MAISAAISNSACCALVAALLLGGCGADELLVGDPIAASAPDAITVGFEPRGSVGIIIVTTVDRLPLRSAVLVGPDGQLVPAHSLAVAPRLAYDTSIAADPLLETRGGVPSATRIEIMRSTALIQIPDTVRYAHSWREWRIALRLGDSGNGAREVTLAAPAPPA